METRRCSGRDGYWHNKGTGIKMQNRVLSLALIAACFLGAPSRAQEMADLRTYCMSDIERLCKGIEPGGGRILKCLKAHKKDMTVGCAQALQKLKARRH
jgi:Cysteine rich repeat